MTKGIKIILFVTLLLSLWVSHKLGISMFIGMGAWFFSVVCVSPFLVELERQNSVGDVQ